MPRYILTGAPGAGKTAVLRLLEVSGYTVVEEAATDVIRQISLADSLVFERLHEQTYRDLGFQLTEIPAGPLDERTALIQHAIRQP